LTAAVKSLLCGKNYSPPLYSLNFLLYFKTLRLILYKVKKGMVAYYLVNAYEEAHCRFVRSIVFRDSID
jgi:hypothetical protein